MIAPGTSSKHHGSALAVVVLVGWVVRAWPLFVPPGALSVPIDYDEGVYFAASALLFDGVLPYRDFVFVHPPGVLYALGPIAALVGHVTASSALVAARVLVTLVGALNIALIARLATRWSGPVAGLVAASLYAVAPEVVRVERGPFLEPFLATSCLWFTWCWLASDAGPSPRDARLAGLAAGLAVSIKVWAGLWVIAALATAPNRRAALHFVGAMALTVTLLVGPLVALAPGAFLTDVGLFQAWRPPDGQSDRLARVVLIFGSAHAPAAMLALVGLAWWPLGSAERRQRFVAFVYLATVVSFFASPSYWRQYNAHLATTEALLAGAASARLASWVTRRWPRLTHAGVLAAAVLGLCATSFIRATRTATQRLPGQVHLAQALRPAIAAGQQVCAFEPAWTMLADGLPRARPGDAIVVDTYAMQLLAAAQSGQRFASADEAFASAEAQALLRAAFAPCDLLVVGERGRRQLGPTGDPWLKANFVRDEALDPSAPEVWARRATHP